MAVKTLNISLDEKLLKKVDKVIAEDLATRSEYFRRLALNDIRRREEWRQILKRGQKVGKQYNFTSEEDALERLS